MDKTCNTCKQVLPLSAFTKNVRLRYGVENKCRQCKIKYQTDFRIRYKEEIKKYNDNYYRNNLQKFKGYGAKYYKQNKEIVKRRAYLWSKTRPEKKNHYTAMYRTTKNNAMPTWLTNDHLKWIAWYYKHAKKMTEITGIPHQVDHIHPLRGKTFNGLHVPWNLQVIPATENMQKGNKLLDNHVDC